MRSPKGRSPLPLPSILAATALAGAACLTTGGGAPREAQPASGLVGAWRAISVEKLRPDGSVSTEWMGARPSGLIVYDASGWMSVQLGRDPRATWATSDRWKANQEEKAAAFEGHYAYFGRYEVDGKAGVVRHHVERSLWPSEVGTTYRRSFSLEGDRLILTTPPLADGSHNRVVWERVRDGR